MLALATFTLSQVQAVTKLPDTPPRTLMSAKSSPSWRPRLVFVILNVVPVHVCSKTRRKKKKRIKKKTIIQW